MPPQKVVLIEFRPLREPKEGIPLRAFKGLAFAFIPAVAMFVLPYYLIFGWHLP